MRDKHPCARKRLFLILPVSVLPFQRHFVGSSLFLLAVPILFRISSDSIHHILVSIRQGTLLIFSKRYLQLSPRLLADAVNLAGIDIWRAWSRDFVEKGSAKVSGVVLAS